jgi:hypothetical protein
VIHTFKKRGKSPKNKMLNVTQTEGAALCLDKLSGLRTAGQFSQKLIVLA